MLSSKPLKESVAFYAEDANGRFLTVQRPHDDDHLSNVWGLPAGSIREGETAEDAIRRSAKDKLGVEVTDIQLVGDDTDERKEYKLHLREYKVKLVGKIDIAPRDGTVTLYQAYQYTDDPTILLEAARRGSLCNRIFLRNRGLWPETSDV